MRFYGAHAHQKRCADGLAHKAVAAFLKITAQRYAVSKFVYIVHKAVFVGELRCMKPCVVNHRFYLAAIAYDGAVLHERLCVLHLRDAPRLKAKEGLMKSLALVKYGAPRKPGLKAFEAQLFEKRGIAVLFSAVFLIVVGAHQRIIARGP